MLNISCILLNNFIDPIVSVSPPLDSFLTTRSHLDNEATRMMKTQFMALWDGLITNNNTQIVVVGATNRPGDLDQAILRRLSFKVNDKYLYAISHRFVT